MIRKPELDLKLFKTLISSLVQVVPYAEEEIRRIQNGKYNDPEPIYDKTNPGHPYTDRRLGLNLRPKSAEGILTGGQFHETKFRACFLSN